MDIDLSLTLGFAADKHEEVEEHDDEYYAKKIQELVDEKMRMFLAQKKSEEVKKDEKNKMTMTGGKRPMEVGECSGTKENKMTTTMMSGCKRPMEMGECSGTKKNKMTTTVMTGGKRPMEVGECSGTKEEKEMKMKKKKKKKKKKTIVRTPVVSNDVTDELKEFIAGEMNGSDTKLVIQKSLYTSDLKKDQNRLSMPMNQVETHEFLTADDKRALQKGGEMAVPLVGPSLALHPAPMVLMIWHLKSTDNYVLKNKWNDFVKENKEELKEGTKIQVWSFRRDRQLYFAVACVDRDHMP